MTASIDEIVKTTDSQPAQCEEPDQRRQIEGQQQPGSNRQAWEEWVEWQFEGPFGRQIWIGREQIRQVNEGRRPQERDRSQPDQYLEWEKDDQQQCHARTQRNGGQRRVIQVRQILHHVWDEPISRHPVQQLCPSAQGTIGSKQRDSQPGQEVEQLGEFAGQEIQRREHVEQWQCRMRHRAAIAADRQPGQRAGNAKSDYRQCQGPAHVLRGLLQLTAGTENQIESPEGTSHQGNYFEQEE